MEEMNLIEHSNLCLISEGADICICEKLYYAYMAGQASVDGSQPTMPSFGSFGPPNGF